jgi:hypothetical protein
VHLPLIPYYRQASLATKWQLLRQQCKSTATVDFAPHRGRADGMMKPYTCRPGTIGSSVGIDGLNLGRMPRECRLSQNRIKTRRDWVGETRVFQMRNKTSGICRVPEAAGGMKCVLLAGTKKPVLTRVLPRPRPWCTAGTIVHADCRPRGIRKWSMGTQLDNSGLA